MTYIIKATSYINQYIIKLSALDILSVYLTRRAFSLAGLTIRPGRLNLGNDGEGKPIMMFRVNLINYLVKLHLKCINEYCIRISEILCIIKCVVMIGMKTRHILFW